MTLRMLDSITVGNLPPGADAYLGYVGGRWPTFAALSAAFPHARLLPMAISADEEAEGCDCEAGDLTPAQVPGWVEEALRRGVHRPVVYADASSMPTVAAGLSRAGIALQDVRLLSAHYGAGMHICGPSTCRSPGVPACDGTQWRDDAPGLNGSKVDESVLAADFFGAVPVPAPKPATPPAAPAARKEIPMILVEVDRATVPEGTAWPGVFLLGSDATLHHVTSSLDVAAYQHAGIPGPVPVTWSEYLARSGKAA